MAEATPAIEKKTDRKALKETVAPELLSRRRQTVLVYIGPHAPFGYPVLTSTVFRGSIPEPFERVCAEHPEVRRFIIPVEKLAACRNELRTKGSSLNRAFTDLKTKSLAARNRG